MLNRIIKNCKENLEKNGWVATDKLTMADIYIFTWMSIFCFNSMRTEITDPIMKKFPLLTKLY